MTFEFSDVKKVLAAFRDGAWDRIHLRDEDSELFLSTFAEDEPTSAPAPAPAPQASVAAAVAAPAPAPAPASAPGATTVAPPAGAPAAAETTPPAASSTPVAGSVEVQASSMGIFWRSPSPGAPPFVAVGDVVEEDTTVCIVEVMKLMHRITAGVRGVVHEVLVENGVPVVADEPLFRIAPDG